jgi:hypothetical protein
MSAKDNYNVTIGIFFYSDPYAKVKVFVGEKEGKMKRYKFETKTVWKNLAPVWNEKQVETFFKFQTANLL